MTATQNPISLLSPPYFKLQVRWRCYSAFGLAPSGPAQALFKTTTRFVLQPELFRIYNHPGHNISSGVAVNRAVFYLAPRQFLVPV
ncbi:hypothetical protein C3432_16900 [Citrobacter amalonaticus]|uniref:Uncharacterized protein n=1 Tax=Citrobacter amalonaticus TaxID=35703 RepID=A0A2S4RU79_CITAM|nr:hypothetical protein C3432_16900 [Citrobacter amalonaticus]POT72665.1 hypothetical protein C3436_20985 [Citrobacter amalonaticus]POU63520.1 hypothetical protein C3430_19240 [Citrobacter amalonaticus]POV03284.1 hypothetical protein C3424_22155 [Citrobacter amalonaticus]